MDLRGFLRTGVTRACRCDDGNEPDWRDVLTSLVRMCDIIGRDLTSRVGQGSRPHCLLGVILSMYLVYDSQ